MGLFIGLRAPDIAARSVNDRTDKPLRPLKGGVSTGDRTGPLPQQRLRNALSENLQIDGLRIGNMNGELGETIRGTDGTTRHGLHSVCLRTKYN